MKPWIKPAAITLVMLLLVTGAFIYYIHPNAKHNREASVLLEQFYEAFTDRDYAGIATMMDSGNPQQVRSIRHWYGNVTGYRIISVRNVRGNRKEAIIQVFVTGNNQEVREYDRIGLVERDSWFITSYNSSLRPQLP